MKPSVFIVSGFLGLGLLVAGCEQGPGFRLFDDKPIATGSRSYQVLLSACDDLGDVPSSCGFPDLTRVESSDPSIASAELETGSSPSANVLVNAYRAGVVTLTVGSKNRGSGEVELQIVDPASFEIRLLNRKEGELTFGDTDWETGPFDVEPGADAVFPDRYVGGDMADAVFYDAAGRRLAGAMPLESVQSPEDCASYRSPLRSSWMQIYGFLQVPCSIEFSTEAGLTSSLVVNAH